MLFISEFSTNELVPAICPQCGAPIEVNPDLEASVCSFCGTPFITKNAIDKFYITNNVNIHNSNDTYNVQVGKKGFAQSAFEYMGKRAEAREKASAEAREQARQAAERLAIQEAEARERARIKEEKASESHKSFWRGIGNFFLWSAFFPVMLIVLFITRASEKRQNTQLISHGFEPKELTPIPFIWIIVGAFFFLATLGNVIGEERPVTSAPPSSTTTSSAVSSSHDIPSNWYENEPIIYDNEKFSEETVTDSFQGFQFEIPKSWNKREQSSNVFYYPFKTNLKTYLMLGSLDIDDGTDFSDDVFYKTIVNGYISGLTRDGSVNNIKVYPLRINGKVAACIEALYTVQTTNDNSTTLPAILYLIPSPHRVLIMTAILGNPAININLDDLRAVVQSVSFTGS